MVHTVQNLRYMRLIPILVSALLGACVGDVNDINNPEPDGDGTTTTAARTLYVDTVHSIMVAKCSAAACHNQAGVTGMYGFAVPDGNNSYDQVVTLPTLVGTYTTATAGVVTKIAGGGHNAVTYSADDDSKIAAWLGAELSARSDPMNPMMPIVDPIARLNIWSGCMSQANFDTAEMAVNWGQLAHADTNQTCVNCHAAGLDTFLSGNGDSEQFFTGLTSVRDFLLKYFTVNATGDVIINTSAMQNAGVGLPLHPHFNLTTNLSMMNAMAALTEFYDLTKTRQMMNLCDPPRLPPM